jgi:hypothetical protein
MTIYADLAEPPTVKRDRYGRPIIEGKPWQRMTTFASLIADKAGLIPWAQEMTAAGLAQRPDLLATVAANLDNKTEIRKAAEAAKEHGGGSSAATLGTALHRLTELNDLGRHMPELHADRIGQYRDCLDRHSITVHPEWVETMVLHDAWGVAGTPDRIVTWNGRHVIADLKTGRDLKYAIGEIVIQLAGYATATAGWDPATESRLTLPDIDPDVALVIHMPAQGDGCELIEVDIKAGREAAEHCLWIRDWRKRRDLMRVVEATAVEAAPPSRRDPERIARSIERVKAAPEPWQAPDEGATLDAAQLVDDVRKGIAALAKAHSMNPATIEATVRRWVDEAHAAPRPIRFTAGTGGATERRKAIYRAAIRLAVLNDNETAFAGTLIGAAVGLEVQPAMTVGMALGSLTIAEADALRLALDGILAGRVALQFDDAGAPELRAVS